MLGVVLATGERAGGDLQLLRDLARATGGAPHVAQTVDEAVEAVRKTGTSLLIIGPRFRSDRSKLVLVAHSCNVKVLLICTGSADANTFAEAHICCHAESQEVITTVRRLIAPLASHSVRTTICTH